MSFDGYRPGAHMKLAYKGEVNDDDFDTVAEILEHLFETFNINHPADYKAHSLSVGDVVVLIDGPTTTDERDAYACESAGWKRLNSFNPSDKNPAWTDRDSHDGRRM